MQSNKVSGFDSICKKIMKLKIIDRNCPPVVPRWVAVCPICGADVIIEDIDEWEHLLQYDVPTKDGFHVTCETEPPLGSRNFDSWINSHYKTPYIDWLPIEKTVYEWFVKNFALKKEEKCICVDFINHNLEPIPNPDCPVHSATRNWQCDNSKVG